MKKFKFYILIFLILTSKIAYTFDKNTIIIGYFTRPPYFISNEDDSKLIDGDIYNIVTKVFNKANIPYEFIKSPQIRTIDDIKENKKKICSTSLFKTKERKEFALYSLPIFQDKKTVIITSKKNLDLIKINNSQNVLANENFKLIVKIGFSYGAYLDEKIYQYKKVKLSEKYSQESKNVIFTSNDNTLMLYDIHSGKADYMFVGRNEAEYLLENNSLFKSSLEIVDLHDIPEGQKRHIMCSKLVGTATMNLLNKEIKKLVKLK